MRPLFGTAAVVAALLAPPSHAGESTDVSSPTDLAGLAERLVRAYHAGDAETLRPHLSPELTFRDPGLDQRFDLDGFLTMAAKNGAEGNHLALEIAWTGIDGNHADVRGTWTIANPESDRTREFRFSIELEFETTDSGPKVVSWLDDFRRRMWKPARGDTKVETPHFRIVYYASELKAAEAKRLGETLEHWYGKTREYLGRSFPADYRLHINVAGGHGSPFASDPGPDAFMLVSTRSARRKYGFSLVHELTHNLMGLSWLSRHALQIEGVELRSGNRLFDEGFAVYVEEKLTGEGPRVFPNFGEETHAAYWSAREKAGEPIWPVLEAEIHREKGDVRLAYLAQASFCKRLVETGGLERFARLFVTDLAEAKAIYGKDFAALDREWRAFLEARFARQHEPTED